MASYVTVGGRRLAYESSGAPEGLPIFWLHGSPGCRLNRYPHEEQLVRVGARLITYDRPGYGQSDRHRGRDVASCVDDVAAIAGDLGIERFAVVGVSGGGPHCLAVAARMPDRVLRARCVVGPAPYGQDGLDWFAGMDEANVRELRLALEGEEPLHEQVSREAAEMVRRAERDPATAHGDADLPAADRAVLEDLSVQQVIRQATAEMFVNGVWGWVDDALALTRPWGFDLSEIRAPVEIWYGDADVLVPPAHGEWLAAHIAGARVKVERDAGHMPGPQTYLDNIRQLVDAARERL